jgi:NADH-quinone oxidoreductase subunit F
VAIIGAGPSGLTAAGDLADMGCNVTIYEARNYAGGMLYWGIPRYRLPKEMLDYEIELIRRRGVNIVLNCVVGRISSFESIRNKNDAVYKSAGAHVSRKLGIQVKIKKEFSMGLNFKTSRKSGRSTCP